MIEWQLVFGFILAIVFVIINGITQLIYAQSLGFKLKPTSLAYFIGAFGNVISGNVVPIAAQAETLTISGLIKNINTRVTALLFAALVGIVLGIFGLVTDFVDFAGKSVIYGMMAGVGLLLSDTALKLINKRKRVGWLSFVSAVIVWVITKDLVYTIAVSVVLSTLDFTLVQKQRIKLVDYEQENASNSDMSLKSEFKIVKPLFNIQAIIGGLSIICLNIGTNISFGTITSSIANKTPNFDHISIINSLADVPSVMFGGMPLETIISGTAATEWPLIAGVVMMLLTGVIILTGLIEKIGRYIPAESISGFLMIIGFSLTLVPNLIQVSESDQSFDGFVSASVTVLTKNAFLGVIVAIFVRFLRLNWGISI